MFKLDDWIVWGADMVRTEDGTCHLLFSHLPKENGFDAWLTHSRIGYATAANPEGPYTFQGDRHYAIVKDHDAPYLTKHGKVLHLMESRDGLDWIRSNHSFVEDLDIRWGEGTASKYQRLEMPKIHLENGVPRVLFLAAREVGSQHSYNIAIPLKQGNE